MKRLIIIGLLSVWCLAGIGAADVYAQQKRVRNALVAGQFYPGGKEALIAQIQEYLTQAEPSDLPGPLHALVAPHAGYIYSGPIAASAYRQIRHPFKRVFILASNHSSYAEVNGLSVPEYTYYATPLGEVRVSPIVRELEQDERIASVPEAHTTHIIEVHLPFLQTVLKEDFEIVPVITGRIDWDDVTRFGELFNRYVDEETLFIVSTDLSHYHPYDEAVSLDRACVRALETLDTRGVVNAELCGQGAALILLEIAKKRGWQGKILDYRNSGDTAGDKQRVVGYGAVAYYGAARQSETKRPATLSPNRLSAEERHLLLELAETTVAKYVKEQETYQPDVQHFSQFPRLTEPRGAFVTLTKQGALRGCIGNLIGQQPLYLTVRDNAIKAAAQDPRFPPVTPEELAAIEVSVSVLDPPRLLHVSQPEEYLTHLTPQDGVILVCGTQSATYLPQVWEQLPQPREFLRRLCLKGGATPDCWRNPATRLYTYGAQEFGRGE
ncbi:AmmeMemoRadiSam system protein B [candidate division KSB3 bacterium]|uniref:AmmeMemoRadiSam system protein B n=1 Tax=candidate division KSB3 bacterium TaxID=2044937 RepID=A0A9D5K030_9BACT|nr:AmmeMemoRadiSam system protein B [candidate division KSB3 bacterium]MBD3327288.1 AmmeMemoRadiSam system protein B [candidate division KSB3 bacterium]